MTNRSERLIERVSSAWQRFRKDRRANVAVIFALALVPTMGVFGLGSEGSYWHGPAGRAERGRRRGHGGAEPAWRTPP